MICQMVDHQIYYAGGAKCDLLSCKESQIIHVATQDGLRGRGWVSKDENLITTLYGWLKGLKLKTFLL